MKPTNQLRILLFGALQWCAAQTLAQTPPGDCVYQEAFGSDPGWVNSDPAKLGWDSASGTFHGTQVSTEGTYAYVNLPSFNPNNSWRLDLDYRINDCTYAGGLTVGLYTESLGYGDGVVLDLDSPDPGHGTSLLVAKGQWRQTFNPGWALGVWYHAVLTFDPAARRVTMTITEAATGASFWQTAIDGVASLPPSMTRLGVSLVANQGGGNYGQVDYNLDNLSLCATAPAPPPCGFLWDYGAPMRQRRSDLASVALNGKVYAIGGIVGGYWRTELVEEYDPVTDSWRFRAPISNPVSGPRAVVFNGKILVFGGFRSTGSPSSYATIPTVEEYDPATNTWTQRAPMPQAAFRMAVGVVAGRIYLIGGGRWDPASQSVIPIDLVQVYDPVANTWSFGTPLPTAQVPAFSYGLVNDRLFVFGNPTYVYEALSDTWSTRTQPVPVGNVASVGSAVVGDKIYTFGGKLPGSTILPDVWEYNTASDVWTAETPMPTAMWCGPGVSMVNDTVYVLGGIPSVPEQSSTVVQRGKLIPCCTIICPDPLTIITAPDATDCGAIVEFPAPTTTGDCGPVTCVPPSGSFFPVGTTTVQCSTAAGEQCEFTVTVIDATLPRIACPPDLTVPTDPGKCEAAVNPGVATASDNCPGVRTQGIRSDGLPLDAPYPKGATTITWTATDSSGNQARCAQKITVVDQEPPAIQCPATVELPCSVEQYVPALYELTATDNCPGAVAIVLDPPSGSAFPIGETVVTVTATDAAGNQSQATFRVIRAALDFAGFLPPLGGADATGGSFQAPLRTIKVGSTVPVKFLAGCESAPVLTGSHRLQVVRWLDPTAATPPIDAKSQDRATIGNQFRLADGQWHFNLDTKLTGMTTGIWQLMPTLSDGSQHEAWIQLK
jgi:N-acetylneuraminic acid mutarotase